MSILRPRKNLNILICGYYGEGNLGDDAILRALLDTLPREFLPIVTSYNQWYIQNYFKVKTVARRSITKVVKSMLKSDILLLGGGSLLQDSTSLRSLLYYGTIITVARIQGKTIILWAQGLGPLERSSSHFFARQLLHAVTGISWRDAKSKKMSENWKIQTTLGDDPVWGYPQQCWAGIDGPIVVCWKPTHLLNLAKWSSLLLELDILSYKCEKPVWWIPFHKTEDLGLLADLQFYKLIPQRLAKISFEYCVNTPAEALSIFRQASIVLSMRLHALILASLAGAPCEALSCDPKINIAAEYMKIHCIDMKSDSPFNNAASRWKVTLGEGVLSTQSHFLPNNLSIHTSLLDYFKLE
uniref:Polysaccharide pyruvyl transferase domain-containing protein n=1 Tax=Paulinella longichromatophora TaxID=1708747 RepID=A0A2H4ZNT2_9EUKA|nr:hypothetical protein PLO_166 [Paulinella longichromatophora]